MEDERRPVVIGAAQLVQRDTAPAEALSPLAMLEQTARAAAADAGAGERLLHALDAVGVVDVVLWRPKNAPGLLAESLGAAPSQQILTSVGGEIPLVLVNELAQRIAEGRVRAALVAGANNIRTVRRARDARVKLDWPSGGSGEPEHLGVTRSGSSAAETAYGIGRPTEVYPLFENALRARRGLGFDEHRRRVGELLSRMSQVAAANPYAWFPVARSADEITTPAPHNRMIAFPYTKFMNAVIETDQAAALILTSAAAAKQLGVPEERWVHWWGGAFAQEEQWYPSERPDLSRSDALRAAAAGALEQAGAEVARVDSFDFYSCFPVAVEAACDSLGLAEDDPRGVTVTGGLPYAGGPGNNYTLHSLAAMAQRLRGRPGAVGLVTGNGWYLTKHAATVLASAPREGGAPRRRRPASPAAVPETTHSTDPAEGRGHILAYTVLYDREGAPARGVVVGQTDAGRRFVANTPDDRDLLEAFVAREEVGRAGVVRPCDGRNVFEPA